MAIDDHSSVRHVASPPDSEWTDHNLIAGAWIGQRPKPPGTAGLSWHLRATTARPGRAGLRVVRKRRSQPGTGRTARRCIVERAEPSAKTDSFPSGQDVAIP